MNEIAHTISTEELEVLKYKDDLLFKLLLLMHQDSRGNYLIDAEYEALVEEALQLYLQKTPNENEYSR